jgi:hypothetical protein
MNCDGGLELLHTFDKILKIRIPCRTRDDITNIDDRVTHWWSIVVYRRKVQAQGVLLATNKK